MPPDDAPLLEPGSRLAERYLIERPLGGGGMGQVFLARDERFERLVAAKVLHSHVSGSAEAKARFEREARTLSLVVHPNLVTVHDYGCAGRMHFLVMEFIDGTPLGEIVKAEGALPIDDAVDLIRQIASGLAELHAANVVHRDVKPANVVVRRLAGGMLHATLVDFGLARNEAASDISMTGAVLGTPHYMAPEQVRGDEIDARADQYALGVMLFELITGRRPFQKDTVQATLIAHLVDPAPNLDEIVPDAPPALVDALSRALAKDPDERYPSVTAFGEALASVGRVGEPVLAHAQTCGACAADVPTGARYCLHCGAAQPSRHCGRCGAPREGSRLHCGRCLAPLLPPSPYGQAVDDAGGVRLPLRAQAAIILVARVEPHVADTPAWRTWTARLFANVEREGGRVLAFVGYEVVAAFGLGGMRPGEVEVSIDVGLAAIAAAAAEGLDPGDVPRIGAEVGAIASIQAGQAWGTTFAVGDVVERARAIAAAASPGALRIGKAAYNDVRSAYTTFPATDGDRVVTGRKAVSYVDYIADTGQPEHVGRDLELAQLHRIGRRVLRRGQLETVVVQAPQGMGKSRLLGAFLADVEDGAQTWHADIARCRRTRNAPPYAPFVDMLARRMQVGPGGEVEATVSALKRLPGLGEEDRTISVMRTRVAHMADLIAGRRDDAGSRPSGDLIDAERRLAFEAYETYLTTAASQDPVLLVIEDVHHASTATLDLLIHLLRACADVPVLVLLTLEDAVGDDVLAALEEQETPTHVLALEPLEQEDVAGLLAWSMPPDAPPQPVIDAVLDASDGVPERVLDAAELLKDSDVCELEAATWRYVRPERAEAVLTQGDEAVLARTLERLSPSAREVAVALAVAEGSAPPDMLAMMLARSSVEQDVAELRRLRFTSERRAGRSTRRDIQLRSDGAAEAFLNATDNETLARLHRRAAEWLRVQGRDVSGWQVRLAHHLLASGETGLGVDALLAAGDDALARYAGDDALALFEQAADEARRAGGTGGGGWMLRRECRSLLAVAETAVRVGKPDPALAATERVLALVDGPEGDKAAESRAWSARGDALDAAGKRPEALQAFERALALLDEVGEDALQRAFGSANEGEAVVGGGPREPSRSAPTRRHLQSRAAMIHFQLGDDEQAASVAETALAEAEIAGRELAAPADEGSIGRLMTVLGHVAWRARRLDDADDRYAEALLRFMRGADRIGAAMATLCRGNIAYDTGDKEGAADRYREATQRSRSIGYVNGVLTAGVNLGHVLMDLDRLEEAEKVLEECLQEANQTGVRTVMTETLRLLAEVRAQLGKRQAAEQVAREAVESARASGNAPELSSAERTLRRVSGSDEALDEAALAEIAEHTEASSDG